MENFAMEAGNLFKQHNFLFGFKMTEIFQNLDVFENEFFIRDELVVSFI
jgi:hypothetical protein